MRCGAECSMLGWLMQHAAVAVAQRCADGVNNFDIPFHEIYLPLPSIPIFVPIDSNSCSHEFCRSFPRIRILAFTDSVVPFHEFKLPLSRIQILTSMNSNSRFHEIQHSLPSIQTFLSTNVGKQKRHPFVGMSFSIAFPLSGGAWRIRTAVDGFADR